MRSPMRSYCYPSVLSFLMQKSHNKNDTDTVKLKQSKLDELSRKPVECELSDLPFNPGPKIPHMDVLEADKLEWTLDLPRAAKTTPSIELTKSTTSSDIQTDANEESEKNCAARQARFDLSGLVVSPDADVDTHLGLHHHGEEPERAGYTIGEMFHLCRSSVPAQRRLALSMLASSLTQTRLGKHISYLAPINSPSLITYLLSSKTALSEDSNAAKSGGSGGILFLLRWCLDEAVSTLTSANSVGGDSGSCGASLTLVVECIRCLANLICDTQGEIFLNYAHEWSIESIHQACLFVAPPVQQINPNVKYQQLADEQSDDSELAASDPVEFLFLRSKLARRIAWLLAPGKGRVSVCLPADAAGLWLPSLIIRGLRHSPSVAYEIFRTPELISALLIHYLPINEYQFSSSTNSNVNRPNYLFTANNIPLPSVMRLCRIWIQGSYNILLAFVSDHHLIERCLSYLCNDKDDTNITCLTTAHLVAFLHKSLPLRLAVQLQIESLRCLGVCISQTTVPCKAVHLIQKKLSDVFHSAQNCWILYRLKFITGKRGQISHLEEDYYLVPLLTSWLHFLVNLSQSLIKRGNNCTILQTVHMILDNVLSWCCDLGQHVAKNLESDLITPVWEDFEHGLTVAGLNTSLMAVVVTSIPTCLHLLSRIDLQPKIAFHEQVINHWNQLLMPISRLNFWNEMLCRFVRNESVLTGYPVHVRDVSASLLPESSIPIHTDKERKLDWNSVDCSMILDDGILQLVSLSPNNCLPDYGCTLHFAYNAHYRQLTGLMWPRVNSSLSVNITQINKEEQHDECDQVSFNPEQMNTRYIPLMSALVSVLESIVLQFKIHMMTMEKGQLSMITKMFLPLIDWIKRICKQSYLQWKSLDITQGKSSVSYEPHILIAIESELVVRILLLFSQILEQDECDLSDYLKLSLFSDIVGGYNIIHLAALRILPHLRKGQEKLRNRLISEVIFNSRQIELNNFNGNVDAGRVLPRLCEIKELYFHELVHAMTPTATTKAINSLDIGIKDSNSQSNLSTIVEDIHEENSVIQSSNCQSFFKLGPIFSKPRSVCDRLVTEEWAYIPLIHSYLLSKSKKLNEEDENYRKLILDRSLNCLVWITYLQRIATTYKSTDSYSFGFMNSVESIVRLTIGSISYPGAGGLGFVPTGQLLAEILYSIGSINNVLTVNRCESSLLLENVSLPVTCPSYYDVYIDFVNHYNALSYNSPVLANLLLWPCQQACHVKYRRALWGEHQHALNSLRIVLNQLVLPLISFLEPEESNTTMIRVYASAILSGTVQITRQPLLFLIAVHHLNRYLYDKNNCESEFTQQFVRLCKLLPQMKNFKLSSSAHTIGNKTDILNLLRYYKQPNRQWLQINSNGLNSDLHVGIHDSLVHLLSNENLQSTREQCSDYMSLTSAKTFNEAIMQAGIECYDPNSLPKRRQIYWNHLFEKYEGQFAGGSGKRKDGIEVLPQTMN
ncbi:unnamed protein product [Heterobilharzia americana]|nr:unnamed protein product [Heterobilharzia americana]